jgi:mannosyltransferase OCH1-like enzyme
MSIQIPENLKSIIPIKLEVNIPKIIHQTYKSLEQLPDAWKETPNTWKTYNPDWKYMFWSDHDCRELVKSYFPDFLRVFDSYEYNIQRADAIRPILMYIYGGLYVDCDIACKKSIDDLFYTKSEIYLIRTPTNGVVTNCIMASKKDHPFWREIINEMVERFDNPESWWIGKHITVMWTTGPMMFNDIYESTEFQKEIGFLPQEYILPSDCNICSVKPCQKNDSYTVLLSGSSWCDIDTNIMNFLLCNYATVVVVIGIILLAYSLYSSSVD